MAANDHGHGDDLAEKDQRIDDLIAEADQHIASLLAVVDQMKRRNEAQKQISEGERRG